MNKLLIVIALISSTVLLSSTTNDDDKINWLTWEEAMELNEEHPKKIFIDVYTEWCGWCKRMDATTFTDPEVVKYMNDHFYAIKLDAEMKENITFKDQQFKYVQQGKRGIHTLAYSLLEGKLSYPSFVTMTESFDPIAISPGYKQPDQLIKELRFAVE
ncbi:MAG: thioredoxin, partial [Bacteroidetes bacterium]